MEVRNDHAVQRVAQVSIGDVRKVRKSPLKVKQIKSKKFLEYTRNKLINLIVVSHVHSAIEHDIFAAHLQQYAATADVLSRTWKVELQCQLTISMKF